MWTSTFGQFRQILAALATLQKGVNKIMSDLSALSAAVNAETTVTRSAITLLDRLAADVAAAGTDPAALATIVSNIQENSATLASAISANTPGGPPAAGTPVTAGPPTS